MNSTQNKKIGQVKETTMIVGIDVGSEKHYFRAFNWRGIELTRKPVPFSNSMEGFNSFYNTIVELMQENKLEEAMVGIEPTGHYWFDLGQFMGEKDINQAMQSRFQKEVFFISWNSLHSWLPPASNRSDFYNYSADRLSCNGK